MRWTKTLWKVIKTALITGTATTVASPREVVANVAVSLVTGLVNGLFNWWKHR